VTSADHAVTRADGAGAAHSGSRVGHGVRAATRVREHAWAIGIWAAMTVWALVMYGIVRDSYVHFRVGRFDLGNMVQAVWNTAHGRPLEETQGATGELMSRLGGHVDPFLALLASLWTVWPTPLVLGLAQVVVVALGALPVFWLGRRRLGSRRAAGLLALSYLAYPWVATSAGAAIHPVTFAITFFLFCVWFLETRRLVWFAVFAVLALSTGELMGVTLAALGLWYAFVHREWIVGAVIAMAGFAWTVIAIYVVVPAFAGRGSIFFGFYDQVGGSPSGVVKMLFTHPGTVLGALVQVQDFAYLLWLGIPLLFLFVLSPGLAAVALPQLLANGLSDFRSMTDPRYHTVAAVIPFLIAATVLGIAKLDPSRRVLAASAVLVCSTILSLVVAPWPRAVGSVPLGGIAKVPPARIAALRDAIALVPSGAPVTASNPAGSHLAARRYVYSVPNLGRATWAVVDLGDPWVVHPDSPLLTRHPGQVRAFAARLEADPSWTKVFDRDGVLVFRKLSG
jgi:uncharacterized membrane protein